MGVTPDAPNWQTRDRNLQLRFSFRKQKIDFISVSGLKILSLNETSLEVSHDQ